METVLAFGLRRGENYSTSGLAGLQRCSSWMTCSIISLKHLVQRLHFLTELNCAARCIHNAFKTVFPDRYPGFFIIATAGEKASHFVFLGSQLYVFYTVAQKRALTKTLQMERVSIPTFFVFVDMATCNMRSLDETEVLICAILPILFCLMYLLKLLIL